VKPVIGISPCISYADDPQREFNKKTEIHYIQLHYMDLVRNGGGLPVILPLISDEEEAFGFAQKLDGIILTGGPADVDPALYGEENTDSKFLDPKRDAAELMLVHAARKEGTPLLGVCRGIQIMNAALGGKNIQDIASTVENCLNHPITDKKEVFHEVDFVGDSFLTEIFGHVKTRVNSSHHQSVDIPAPGLTVIAQAPDGVIEAVQNFDDYFTVGVQWHPERMQSTPGMVELSKHFIRMAAER